MLFIHSFIHSGYFFSASSSTLLLRGPPDTARILCRSFTPKSHRQLQVKDLPSWRLGRDWNQRPFGRKVLNLPMSHHAQQINVDVYLVKASFSEQASKVTSFDIGSSLNPIERQCSPTRHGYNYPGPRLQ